MWSKYDHGDHSDKPLQIEKKLEDLEFRFRFGLELVHV